MLYLRLFWEFFKTGLFAVGGGLATLPFLQDMADRTGWFTRAQLADMLAVSESTPGPIGVNMATYVGFTAGGVGGALIATLGLVTPSVIVILIVAAFLKAFRDSKWVSAAFYGLRPASTALVAAAGISVVLIALVNVGGTGLALLNWKAIALARMNRMGCRFLVNLTHRVSTSSTAASTIHSIPAFPRDVIATMILSSHGVCIFWRASRTSISQLLSNVDAAVSAYPPGFPAANPVIASTHIRSYRRSSPSHVRRGKSRTPHFPGFQVHLQIYRRFFLSWHHTL